DQLKATLTEGLSQGPIEIVVVGDTTVDAVAAAVGATFGALPARGARPAVPAGGDVLRFPAGTPQPVALTHSGPADQALAYVAWPTTDAVADATEARQLDVLASVMELRVLDRIREELAIAYSPGVGSSSSDVFAGYGSIFASAQTSPENLATFFAEMDAIAAALRDAQIDEDELTRARAPQIEALRRALAGNEYWLTQLVDASSDANAVNDVVNHIADLEAVTPAMLQALAQRYLNADRAWRAQVVSAAAAAN
ncbi:MAG: M16 family metallopeptidase, partial [Brevundimonas sp.]